MSDAWYLHDGKKQFGPFTVHELIATLATYPNPLGIFTWRAGFEGWRSSGDVPELANLLSAPPPPCLPTLKADPQSRIGLSEAKRHRPHIATSSLRIGAANTRFGLPTGYLAFSAVSSS